MPKRTFETNKWWEVFSFLFQHNMSMTWTSKLKLGKHIEKNPITVHGAKRWMSTMASNTFTEMFITGVLELRSSNDLSTKTWKIIRAKRHSRRGSFKEKYWVPLGRYPSSSPNITPYWPIQTYWNPYIPTFPFWILLVPSKQDPTPKESAFKSHPKHWYGDWWSYKALL